jgi:hypothetical protein
VPTSFVGPGGLLTGLTKVVLKTIWRRSSTTNLEGR